MKIFKHILLFALLSTSLCSHAAFLSLQAADEQVTLGESIFIDIVVDGFMTDDTVIAAYDFDITQDASLVSYTDTQFSSALDPFDLGSIQDASLVSEDTINVFELSFDFADDLLAVQGGTFVLATLEFVASSMGDAIFSIGVNALGDANGDAILYSTENSTEMVEIIAPVISVSEPPALGFLLMICLAGWLRKSTMHKV